jgi:ABC-2 type transport system permease protein
MRALDLAIKDLLQIVRDVKSFVFILIMPLVFTFFFGWIFGSVEGDDDLRLPIAVANLDTAADLSAEFARIMDQSDAIRSVPVEEGMDELEKEVLEENFAAAVMIPSGYSQEILSGGKPRLTVIYDPYSQAGDTAYRAIEAAVTRLLSLPTIARISADVLVENGAISSDQHSQVLEQSIDKVISAWETPPVRLESVQSGQETEESAEVFNAFGQSSPGMIVQFSVFGLITAANILVLERKKGVLARMLTTPITRVQIIGGHILAMFTLVFVQVGILILIGQFAFGLDYFAQPGAVLLLLVCLAIFSASMGLFIGAIAKGEDQVIMFSMLAMFALSALGGAWFPLDITGETFARIGHLLPSAWAMDGFQNIILRGQGLEAAWLPAVVLLGYSAAFFGIAIWRFDFE